MITVRDVEKYLYSWAPHELAESWDNVGLLVGDGEAEVKRVLVSLDITEAVVDEAVPPRCVNPHQKALPPGELAPQASERVI